MSSVKLFYAVLFSGFILYFLLYSFLVRKLPQLPALPVVKIYFEEEETPKSDIHLQQYFAGETSLNLKLGDLQMADGDRFSSPVQDIEISSRDEKTLVNITSEKEQNADKRDILKSFLEGLGMPVNESLESLADISTNAPSRVRRDGALLSKLMMKIDRDLNLEIGKPCPTSHLNEVGFLEVDENTENLDNVERELDFVEKGGQWKPDCTPRKKVAIVVPFRDRHEHLYIFLRHMHQFLRWQMLEYRIFIVEQADGEPFNRGMLMNVGFSEAMKAASFTCIIFHDVDLIPEDARNDYGCPSSPRHMSTAVKQMDYKLMYKKLFGGVEGFWTEHYRQVNGFPNRFWGWGGEDDDLYVRVTEKRLGLTRPAQMIGRYTMLGHSHDGHDPNPERFDELRRSEASIDMDGLNTLTYSVLDYQEMPLYTLISVSLR